MFMINMKTRLKVVVPGWFRVEEMVFEKAKGRKKREAPREGSLERESRNGSEQFLKGLSSYTSPLDPPVLPHVSPSGAIRCVDFDSSDEAKYTALFELTQNPALPSG